MAYRPYLLVGRCPPVVKVVLRLVAFLLKSSAFVTAAAPSRDHPKPTYLSRAPLFLSLYLFLTLPPTSDPHLVVYKPGFIAYSSASLSSWLRPLPAQRLLVIAQTISLVYIPRPQFTASAALLDSGYIYSRLRPAFEAKKARPDLLSFARNQYTPARPAVRPLCRPS